MGQTPICGKDKNILNNSATLILNNENKSYEDTRENTKKRDLLIESEPNIMDNALIDLKKQKTINNILEEEDKIVSENKDNYFSNEDLEFYSKKFPLKEREKKKKKKIQFKPGEVLGSGSFGNVILGFNNRTGEIMAVKQVHFSSNNNPKEKISALKLEIELLSELCHKNIVRYIGTSKQKNSLNIFLEYVSGGSLSTLISKFGKLNDNVIRKYTKEILEGLEYLHYHKVIHRDIKGANVLVDNKGTCKLADFGSSKKICMQNGSQQYNTLMGTVNWMAPEVIKQSGHGRFADIWSLGCTILEMATGRPPFNQFHNPITTMIHICQTNESPIPKELNKNLGSFLECCLQKNPTDRSNVRKLLNHPFISGYKEIVEFSLSENKKSNEKKKKDFNSEKQNKKLDLNVTKKIEDYLNNQNYTIKDNVIDFENFDADDISEFS